MWRFGHIEERWSARLQRVVERADDRAPRRRPPLPFRDLEEVAAAVRSAGGRLSAPRAPGARGAVRRRGPGVRPYLAGGLAAARPEVDLASVYRNLEQLEELGVVRHVHVGHGPGLYALVGAGEREYLVCERCDRVTTVAPAQLDEVRALVERTFGYRARFTHFPITGLCPACAAEGDAPAAGEHAHEHSHGDYVHAHPHVHAHGRGHGH